MHNQLAILALAAVLIIPIGSNVLAQNDTAGNDTAAAPVENVTAPVENVTTTEPPVDNATVGNVTEPPAPLPEPGSPGMQECTAAYPNNPQICEGAFGAEPDCVIINAQGGVYNIQVNPPDPFRLDNDADGLGCEISQLQGQPPSEPQTNATS